MMLPHYNLDNCRLTPNNTIKDAITNLIQSSMRIVLVVNEENRFLGTVSDGDIRRGILSGLDLNSPLVRIMNNNSIIVTKNTSEKEVKNLMKSNKVQHIPIVDDENYLLGLYEWNITSELEVRKNQFVIMAGGRGERLLPQTKYIPKPMIPINGRPMIEHIILRARSQGFFKFILILHHLAEVVKDYFGDGSKLGVSITYLTEENPLGTAGGLAAEMLDSPNPILVTNCDVLSHVNYRSIIDFHVEMNSLATMAVRQHEIRNPFGVVEIRNSHILSIEEKPIYQSYINAGIYVFSSNAFKFIKINEYLNMTDLFKRLSDHGQKICAYPLHEMWLDVGSPDDLNSAPKEFL